MSAPSAAVAVQPYQYIAGARNAIDGPDNISRMMRAREHNAERGIDGEQRDIQLERDHIEDRERGPVCKGNLRNECEAVMTRSP